MNLSILPPPAELIEWPPCRLFCPFNEQRGRRRTLLNKSNRANLCTIYSGWPLMLLLLQGMAGTMIYNRRRKRFVLYKYVNLWLSFYDLRRMTAAVELWRPIGNRTEQPVVDYCKLKAQFKIEARDPWDFCQEYSCVSAFIAKSMQTPGD